MHTVGKKHNTYMNGIFGKEHRIHKCTKYTVCYVFNYIRIILDKQVFQNIKWASF